MIFFKNVSLAQFTTFKIGGPAGFFCEAKSPEDAAYAVRFAKEKLLPIFVLGGGSNLLISDRGFNGLVIKAGFAGKAVMKEDQKQVLVKVSAGEKWDSVAVWAVKKGWWGLENLSHIPGSCGAIAVQNIGAYGQEASNVIVSVTALDTKTGRVVEKSRAECKFGYRSSIFNQQEKNRYVIFGVVLKLSKFPKPILTYRDLKSRFEGRKLSLRKIRDAIISIRNSKYPFPRVAKNGNAGSFFKNISVGSRAYAKFIGRVKNEFGAEVSAAVDKKKFLEKEGGIKIPAAALIEICGLKNLSSGGAKISQDQPLVIVNKSGRAKADDVLALARIVIKTVWVKLGVKLKIEPVLLGFTSEELGDIEI